MLFGLAGEAESGKDTFADVLVDHHKYTKLSFAKNLKEMCKSVFDLSDYDVYDTKGKETPFEIPVELVPGDLVQIAKWIKEETSNVRVSPIGLSVSIHQCWELQKVTFKSPRELLQFIGTEVCRDCWSENYHIDVVKAEMEGLSDVVVADARFANEREKIKEWGGFNIKVIDPNKKEEKNAGIQGHQSETEMNEDDFDLTFFNDKTLGFEILQARVEEIRKAFLDKIYQKHV